MTVSDSAIRRTLMAKRTMPIINAPLSNESWCARDVPAWHSHQSPRQLHPSLGELSDRDMSGLAE